LRDHMLAHMAQHPCADCGETDVRVLEFDHVGAKEDNMSTLLNLGVPLARFAAELARCDVVCVNCHRRRTATRGGWSQLTPPTASETRERPRRWRNVEWVRARLRESKCTDCGERDPLLLEYDHVGPKRNGVMKLARDEVSIRLLEEEVEQCEVRCCNCHRRRTADRGRWARANPVTLEPEPL
jgi:hypothetical protein